MNLRLARLNMHTWMRSWVLAVTFTWMAANLAKPPPKARPWAAPRPNSNCRTRPANGTS